MNADGIVGPICFRGGVVDRLSDRMVCILFVVIWGVVIAVADANWPSHMGESWALRDALIAMVGL